MDLKSTDNRKLWFKSKTYGWGWTPATWEGWVVIGAYTIFVVGLTSWITKQAGLGLINRGGVIFFIGTIIVMTGLMIMVCYKTGEKPRWRWGEEKKENRN